MLKVTMWLYLANEGRVFRKTVEAATKNGHCEVQTPKLATSRLYFDGKV